MKHYFTVSLILLLLLSFGFSSAADPVAIVIKVKGKASITAEKSNRTLAVKRGTRIFGGSKIKTQPGSFVALKFIDDGSLLRIRPNSSCVIKGKREKASLIKNIFLEVGTIFSKITRQKSKFSVSTPTSVASVKGTTFWTKQEFKGGTYYFGEEGVIELSNKRGSALLKAGETGYVSSPNSKPIVRKTRPGEKPTPEANDQSNDEFDLEFQNKDGETKTLKFKIKKK